jgi:NDP-sugar pyrophosphorylase family protein
LEITYSKETEPLGTWGAIRVASKHVNNPDFVVLNGDSWLQIDLRQFVEFHRQKQAIASIAAVEVENGSRFGSIQLDASGLVTEFTEKRTEGRALVNGGVYVFSRDVFISDATTGFKSLEQEVLPMLLARGVYSMRVKGYFVDIGVPEAYRSLVHETASWMRALESGSMDEDKC